MTRDAWKQSANKDVLFPDDLPGFGPVQVVGEPLEATDVETDTVSHGVVARLGQSYNEDYVVTPKQLRSIIGEAWLDDQECAWFEVIEAQKGPKPHDPWKFEYECLDGDFETDRFEQ